MWNPIDVRNKKDERKLLGKAMIAAWLAILFVQQSFTMSDPEFSETQSSIAGPL